MWRPVLVMNVWRDGVGQEERVARGRDLLARQVVENPLSVDFGYTENGVLLTDDEVLQRVAALSPS
jgi:hypothetical protein